MDSSFIRKRKAEKAKDYALQRERVSFVSCAALFRGDNGDHAISYDAGKWSCDCDYLIGRDTCAHIMALQMMLAEMVEAGAEA